jgi:hypothetical protein
MEGMGHGVMNNDSLSLRELLQTAFVTFREKREVI